MKHLTLIILISILLPSCKAEIDVSDAVNGIAERIEDAVDGNNRGRSNRDTDETEDTEETHISDVYEHENGLDYDTGDSNGLGYGTGPKPSRTFLGTYSKGYEYSFCPDFPQVLRLYSWDGTVDLENNKGQLVSRADIFEDDTFDFAGVYNDVFGRPSIDLSCTCSLTDNTYYSDEMRCSCDYGTTSCKIYYKTID